MIALSPLDVMVAQFRIKGYVAMFFDAPTCI
jgi:Sec-independent protein secretion pathway component TatC